jgi:hypothetical protein
MSNLGLINVVKEQSQAFQPLMLAEFAMPDGLTVLRLATQDLTPSGFQHNGNPYLPRILNQDMAAFQLLSQQGVSVPPTVTLKLADADKLLWGYEMSIGFRGAVLTIRFVFWQVGTSNFSSDSIVYGPFLCSAASNVDDTSLTIPAGSKLNMEQIQAPFIHIQQTCPWSFPTTAAQRLDGATNQLSEFWECGYSPDVAGAQGGCGNYQSGTTPYTTCGFTKGDCVARGMYMKDSLAHKTGRFGGMQFQPPTALKSRSYVSGNWQEIYNNLNESKYGDFVPLLYGTQWVDCPVIVSTGDANMAKFEVIVCYGQPQAIQQVVLNDTLIPCSVDLNGQSYPVSDVAFCWRTVNNGARSGAPNLDTLFNGLGDPYGSYCSLEIVVPVQLASSASAPRVRVLVNGPAVRIYRTLSQVVVSGGYATATINAVDVVPPTWNSASNQFTITGTGITGIDGTFTGAMHNWSGGAPGTIQFATTAANGTYTGLTGLFQYEAFTTRPVWALLDVLLWCGWNIADINIPSLVAADAVCGQQVSYQDQYGHTQTKDRYKYSNVLRQRRSAAQVVRGILGAMNAVAVPNAGGALTLLVKQTLADQQAALQDGSNSSTPLASVHADGSVATGYVAYAFDESSVIRDNEGRGKPKLAILQRANSDLPALVTVQWQDEDNQYVVDSLTLADLQALQRVSQNTTAASPGEGFANYDQARRIVNTWFAENCHGNPRNDPGGTFQVQLTTTFKGVKLQIGQIVMLSWAQAGISQQLFRILQLKPSTDFETADLLLQWHSDAWYTNAYGQAVTPGGNGSASMLPLRPPYPALTGRSHYGQNPDPLYPDEWTHYGMWSAMDWAGQTLQQKIFRMNAVLPVNTFSQSTRPPFLPAQATSSPTGGGIAGGQNVWCAFAAEDASGLLTPLSGLVSAYIPAGTNTNTVTVSGIQWAPGTVAFHAWIGNDPQRLYYTGRGAGPATTTTFTAGLNVSPSGDISVPDQAFQTLRVRVKRVMHPGVWMGTVTGVTATTITVSGAGWTANQWAGRVCSFVGLKVQPSEGSMDVPPAASNFLIVSNTTDTLTINPAYGPPPNVDPTGTTPVTYINPSAGDLVQLVIRTQNTQPGLINGIGDSNLSLTANAEINRIVRIISGTGRGQTATIQWNDAGGHLIIQGTWPVTPDATSIFWIEEPGWGVTSQDFNPGQITNPYPPPQSVPQFAIDVAGFAQQYLMLEPVAVSASGAESLDAAQSVAIRDFYLFDDTGSTYPGQIAAVVSIPGTLAIAADIGPIVKFLATATPKSIHASVKQAPSGAAITVVVYAGSTVYATVTIAAGQTEGSVSCGAPIAGGTNIRVDLTTVGTTYPGSDLSVFLYA